MLVWVRNNWQSLLLILSALFLSIVGIEITLQLVRPFTYLEPPQNRSNEPWRGLVHRQSSIPGLNYELVPNIEKDTRHGLVITNSEGMRDTAPMLSSKSDLLRIVALGDSVTFGFKVPYEEVYANVLERLLQQSLKKRSIEVMNFGVGGYSTADEVLVLKYKALIWEPNLILIGYVFNDPETDPIQPLHRHFAPVQWWRKIQTLRLIMKVKNVWNIWQLGDGDYVKYLHEPNAKKWNSVVTAFNEIRRLTIDLNIPVIVLIFPIFPRENWDSYEYKTIHLQVASAARNAGLDTLDLLEFYVEYDPKQLWISVEDGHPSILGHKIAARAIMNKLKRDYRNLLNNGARNRQN